MPVRAYLIPNTLEWVPEGAEGVGLQERSSKYLRDLVGVRFSRRPYGEEGVDLVLADLRAGDHVYVAGQADVYAFPEHLDAPVTTARRAAVVEALESRNIPGSWIQASTPYALVLRTVARVVFAMKKFQGEKLGRVFTDGVTLNTRFLSLPAEARHKITRAAVAHRFPDSRLPNTASFRQVLKEMADNLPGRVRLFGVDL
jgi:hypothetical protein